MVLACFESSERARVAARDDFVSQTPSTKRARSRLSWRRLAFSLRRSMPARTLFQSENSIPFSHSTRARFLRAAAVFHRSTAMLFNLASLQSSHSRKHLREGTQTVRKGNEQGYTAALCSHRRPLCSHMCVGALCSHIYPSPLRTCIRSPTSSTPASS